MRPVRVFISYSRESPRHEERVRHLADRLRSDGLEVRLDQDQERLAESLTHWMERQMKEADFTLAVITETYGQRQGTAFESHLMVQDLFAASMRNEKYVPVLFAEADSLFIPRPLRGYRFFLVDTDAGYRALLRHLAGPAAAVSSQPAPVRPRLSVSPWRIAAAMTFLLLLAYLAYRFLPSRTQESLARPPAAGVTVPEPGHAQQSPSAALPRTEPRRKKPAPGPPSTSIATPSVERIEASGTGFCTAQYPSAQRKALARRAAEIVARRNLAEVIETHIRGKTRVVKGNVVDDEILSTVDQVVKGARIIGERELPDGGYEVTLEASLRR